MAKLPIVSFSDVIKHRLVIIPRKKEYSQRYATFHSKAGGIEQRRVSGTSQIVTSKVVTNFLLKTASSSSSRIPSSFAFSR